MPDKSTSAIGYLVPEFPGQTHNFFWREIGALRELGIDVVLVSTRRPPAAVESPTWSAQARERTTYLHPQSPGVLLGDIAWLLARPASTARVIAAVARAQAGGWQERLQMLGLALAGVRLARHLRAQGVAHLHVHSCANSANVAMFAHLAAGLTYSLTLHNSLLDHGPNQAEKWRHASFGIVVAQYVESDMRQRLGSLLPPLLRAPMGVDTEVFKRRTPYTAPGPYEPLRLFGCGRLNPVKGHLDVLSALSLLIASGRDVLLEIAGEDDDGGTGYRRVVEERIRELGLESRVTLLGAVSETVVIERLQHAHVFVLASLAEPQSVALMEAMAMQLPIVVTRVGGVPEMIGDDVEGVLVAPQQPQQLADAIAALAADPQRAQRLAFAARARVEERFSHRRSAQAIAAAVRERIVVDPALQTAQG
jgi:colanic acid/amylovoran biosynthesis glycosyltransferase